MSTISERLDAIIKQSAWNQQPNSSLSEINATDISLSDRLTALNKSVDNWQNHVKKEDLPTFNSFGGNNRASLCLLEKSDEKIYRTKNCLPSNTDILLNLEKGLKSFFFNNVPYFSLNGFEQNDFDVDVIAQTDILKIPKRPVLKKPRRRPRNENRIISIDINSDTYKRSHDHFPTLINEKIGESMAKSAQEGLQATENYSLIKNGLKATNTVSSYPSTMLIRIQGNKKVDVRLVSPLTSSVHNAAVFILVTPNKLYKYEGECSNIMEKATASQICRDIILKNDLHCFATDVEKVSGKRYQSDFFSLLGGSEPSKEPEMFSEPFENIVARINLVLRVTDECEIQSLVKGERVCFSILQPTETLIFDFGSEIYVWSGKHARKASGRYAVEYAQHLRLKPVFNSALLLGESFDEGRADWILYRRVFQGVQETLFSSKFSNWQTSEKKLCTTPYLREIATSSDIEKNEALFLANYLHTLIHPKPVMIIEGYEFTRAMKDVITENISIWMLNGEELEKVDNTTIFNNDLCYVVRWQYRIQQSGVRRLKTGLESEKETGRERVSFFYWLGRRTTSKQQGICALKLSQFDKAKKPHVRVVQGTEPPLFLALFRGKFIVRSLLPDASPFFLIQGATSLEGHAVQLEDNITHLRCHAVYLKITGDIIVIEGPTSSSRSVENALTLASEFMKNKETFGIKDNGTTIISTEKIGTSINWISPIGRVKTPRFYRIYENEASELTSPQYHEDLVFPIMQSYLSDTMLIDTGKKLWIWSEHTPTTFALRVAEYFWASRDGSVTVVLKNSEPVEFIALFPEWREWSAAKIPILPPRDLQDLMSERTKSFTVESLRKRSDLPDGLNMKNLEQYLSKMDFEQVFKMKKVEFDILPLWKQIRLKKEAGLF